MTTPRNRAHRPCIGLVAPGLEQGGGIPSVAEFICNTIERSHAFDLVIVSLATAWRDEHSLSLTRPASWLRGVARSEEIWCRRRFTRVGASCSEFEFQRYQPRRALTEALAECDLIQVVCGSPASACAVCGLGKPVAVHCATRAVVERRYRQTVTPGVAGVWRRWMTTITDRMDRRALESVDAIQVMNSWMLEYAKAINAGRRVIVGLVPPGVDASRFSPALQRNLRHTPYILCVGRLNDGRKNVGLLLRAFAALPGGLKSTTRLVLAGAVGPDDGFWSQVDSLGLRGRVSFAESPTVEELVALYQSAAVFASSSDEEGFGMTIVEAMACGIPVVATRSGGPDDIIRDGHDGYLVGLGSRIELTDRLARLLSNEDLNLTMGNAARRAVLERFDSRIAGIALLDTYDALLDRRASPVCA